MAADGGCQSEEGQVVAGVAFVAVVEAAVAGEPGQRASWSPVCRGPRGSEL